MSSPPAKPVKPVELWRERSFAVHLDDRFINGQFDRVVIHLQDNRPTSANLIDFKTDQVQANSDHLDTLVKKYRPQVDLYRQSLAAMLNLDAKAINAGLLFVHCDRWVRVD